MREISTVEARENFSELLNMVAYGGNNTVLTRRGKPLLALVTLSDLQMINKLKKSQESITNRFTEVKNGQV